MKIKLKALGSLKTWHMQLASSERSLSITKQKKRQKDEAIKSIRGKVSSVFKNLENLKHDKQEQCSRRNCFLILDISENNYKDTDKLVWKTLKSDANNDTKIEQNDQMHWIESFKKDSGNRKSIPNEVCAICPRK